MENNKEKNNKTVLSYLSAIGGAVALMSFFAPWAGCGSVTISGADMASMSEEWYIVLAGAAVIIGSFLIFKNRNELSKSKIYIAISSIIGLGFIIIKYINMQNKGTFDSFEIKWGGVATVLGFILSLIGINFLKDKEKEVSKSYSKELTLFCANCGKQYSSISKGEFCDECGNKL